MLRITTLLCAAILACFPTISFAQTGSACADYENMVSRLEEKYGETKRLSALNSAQLLLEIYANDETGSWTALLVRPNGIACMIDAGQAFTIADPVIVGEPT